MTGKYRQYSAKSTDRAVQKEQKVQTEQKKVNCRKYRTESTFQALRTVLCGEQESTNTFGKFSMFQVNVEEVGKISPLQNLDRYNN